MAIYVFEIYANILISNVGQYRLILPKIYFEEGSACVGPGLGSLWLVQVQQDGGDGDTESDSGIRPSDPRRRRRPTAKRGRGSGRGPRSHGAGWRHRALGTVHQTHSRPPPAHPVAGPPTRFEQSYVNTANQPVALRPDWFWWLGSEVGSLLSRVQSRPGEGTRERLGEM